VKKWLHYPLYLLVLSLGAAGIGDFCQKQTKGFRLQNIFSSYAPTHPSTPITQEEKEHIYAILSQPFTFLKKGQQCFVFASEDGKYVLKLLRWEKLELSPLANFLPFSWIEKKKEEKLHKQLRDFTSYDIAYKLLKEETGLVFLTLSPQKELSKQIEIYDNLHIKHTINTADIAFILQKKVDDFFPYFEISLSHSKIDDLRPFFVSLSDLLEKRAKNHIFDSDITLQYNMGILEGKPVLFDIGNLSYKETSADELASLIFPFLENKNPDLHSWFKQQVQERR